MSATDVKASAILRTPAEHYVQAERLLAEADTLPDHDSPAAARAYELLTATAQVHATLATVNLDVLWPRRSLDSTADRTEDEEDER